MRIGVDYQIFYWQRQGGVSRYHIELVKSQKDLGCEVDIISLISRNRYLHETYPQYMYREKHGYIKLFYNRIMRGLKISERLNERYVFDRIKRKKYDVLHLTWLKPYAYGKTDAKIVVTIHDLIHELFFEKTPMVLTEIDRKKRALYEADAIIAISQNTKNDIIRLYPEVQENKITVVYHGTTHLPDPEKNNEISKLGKYILFVGDRSGYKRGMWFAESVSDIIRQEGISILFVGGGSFSEEETGILRNLGISDKCTQMGLSDAELAYAYRNAVCFVYPTLYEGFGFPILEAFDNGCPVVCTRSSSLPEVAGNAALYFEPEDRDAMTEKISMFIKDDNIRNEMIKKGIAQKDRFSWEKTAAETMAVYEQVCGCQV